MADPTTRDDERGLGPNLGPAITVDGHEDGWFEGWPPPLAIVQAEAEARRARDVEAKETLIQHPETGEFLRGALVEAAYQREKWPEQDSAKVDSDWFWTLSYIVGKALRPDVTDADRLHHIEAGAALLANWHNAVTTRPGRQVTQ